MQTAYAQNPGPKKNYWTLCQKACFQVILEILQLSFYIFGYFKLRTLQQQFIFHVWGEKVRNIFLECYFVGF